MFAITRWKELPERIVTGRDVIGIDNMDFRRNGRKAGIGLMCMWPNFPALHAKTPELLRLMAQFVDKPKRLKCWLRWWKFCFLELKDYAFLQKGYARHLPPWLFVRPLPGGKYIVFVSDWSDGKLEEKGVTAYHWDSENNAYVKYVKSEINMMDTLQALMFEVHAGC